MPKIIEISKIVGMKIGIFPMHEDWLDLEVQLIFKMQIKIFN